MLPFASKGGRANTFESMQDIARLAAEAPKNDFDFLSGLGTLKSKPGDFGCPTSAEGNTLPLWRAVKDPELEQIQRTETFESLHPGQPKYFSDTPEGASSYAQQAVKGFGDPPYTIVETRFPKNFLEPEMIVPVDRNVPAIVIPQSSLPYLKPPRVLDNMPI